MSKKTGGKVVIQTTDLKKTYQMGDNEINALRGVSIYVNDGEMVSIMGPSGSGKSTMMAILGALDRPTSGSYMLNGQEVGQMSESQQAEVRNKYIGFVFQKFNLLARNTILDNVALPLIYAGWGTSKRRERAKEVLEMVGLGDRIDHKPNELSGGQQQRVAVARALVTRPALILADEPTGNLDTKTSEEILGLFRELHQKQGITIVIVTHDPEVMKQTERVIYLRDGQVIELPDHLKQLQKGSAAL